MKDAERKHWERRATEEGFVRVRLRVLATDEGGRQGPLFDGYRANWDIGNRTEDGGRTTNDAPLLLDEQESLVPGAIADVRIIPIAPEFWTHLSVGQEIVMHEGGRIVGRGEVLEVVGPTVAT